MPIKTSISETERFYFCTFTCLNWLPLIETTNLYDYIYKCFAEIQKRGSTISAYVIMPNHIHLLLYLTKQSKPLNSVIGELKRLMSYELVLRLIRQNEVNLLETLSKAVPWHERRKGKKHEVFEHSFDWKLCESEDFILQKLNYMHHNPVSGKWNLAQEFIDYLHSSAGFYENGVQGLFTVTHYKDINNELHVPSPQATQG